MTKFQYRALTADKEEVTGTIDAYDKFTAIDLIKKSFPVVTDIREVKEYQSILKTEIGPKEVSLKQLAILCSQFSIVLASGIHIAKAAGLLAIQCGDKKLQRILKQVAEDIENGYSLADSFESRGTGQLPDTFIETIRAGERAGTLEQSFMSMQIYFEKQSALRAKVKAALAYPVFLLVLAVIVVAIIMIVAMPVFIETFADMGTELPSLTKVVIDVSNFLSTYWWLIAIFLSVALLVVKLYSGTEAGRYKLAKFRSDLPLVGKVVNMRASSQFANTLSTMLAAGLPLVHSMSVTSKVLDNYYLGMKLSGIVPKLEEGRALYECLTECECFPQLLVEMTGTGEETGTLESTLKTVGKYFDQEVNMATSKVTDALQPVILVIMGIIIGVVVIAMYMPMFTMYSGIA